jgi:uncharacterized protein YdeI (YjbR/CyaY-like superfamily)
MSKDARVDAYIAKSADFAKPILTHIRALLHSTCPDIVETLKWSAPAFEHKGILCGMAAFKQHCIFGFWKHKLMFGKGLKFPKGAMDNYGRITSLSELPGDKALTTYIKEAVRLNDEGVKAPAKPKSKVKKELEVPDDLAAALKKNKKAQAVFDGFSYSHKKEYIEWITEAKREETRTKRLKTALQWMSTGKSRNWKYC